MSRSGNSRPMSPPGNSWPEQSALLPAGDCLHLLQLTPGPVQTASLLWVACLVTGRTDWRPQVKGEWWGGLSVRLYNGVCTRKVGQEANATRAANGAPFMWEVSCNWTLPRTETWVCKTWLGEVFMAGRTLWQPAQAGAPGGTQQRGMAGGSPVFRGGQGKVGLYVRKG